MMNRLKPFGKKYLSWYSIFRLWWCKDWLKEQEQVYIKRYYDRENELLKDVAYDKERLKQFLDKLQVVQFTCDRHDDGIFQFTQRITGHMLAQINDTKEMEYFAEYCGQHLVREMRRSKFYRIEKYKSHDGTHHGSFPTL